MNSYFIESAGCRAGERLGHPLDTLTTALCYAWLVLTPPGRSHALGVYVALCAFSCLFITKDEFVHARLCEPPSKPGCTRCSSVLHPSRVSRIWRDLWRSGTDLWLIELELALTLALLVHQLVYWSFVMVTTPAQVPLINNDVYDTLGEHAGTAPTMIRSRYCEPSRACATLGLLRRLRMPSDNVQNQYLRRGLWWRVPFESLGVARSFGDRLRRFARCPTREPHCTTTPGECATCRAMRSSCRSRAVHSTWSVRCLTFWNTWKIPGA